MNVSERRLWSRLRLRQLDGWKFRRQAPIGDYIVDFYCPAARLIVELDGDSHQGEVQFDHDQRRQAWLESKGYKVLRFSAFYPEQDYLEGVMETIYLELTNVPAASSPKLPLNRPRPAQPAPRTAGSGRS
jgi:very-short-patch-repair endonuclease